MDNINVKINGVYETFSLKKNITLFNILEKYLDENKLKIKNQSLSDLDKLWNQIKKKEI